MTSKLLILGQEMAHLYSTCMVPVLTATGLNRMELDVLLFLANNPGLDTASDMARLRGLSKSHISATVERLVQRELLARYVAPQDRRTVHLSLMPGAAQAVTLGREAQAEFGRRLLEGISADDQAALARVLAQMHRNTSASPEKGMNVC